MIKITRQVFNKFSLVHIYSSNMTDVNVHLSNYDSRNAKEVDSQLIQSWIQLNEKIGEGSFGKVYKSKYNGILVAVKKNSEEKTYEREKTILMQLNHKNIITLLGFCDSLQCLVMELCEDTLYNVLHVRKDVKVTWGLALTWARDCAETVDYLHKFKPKPLLHRDLKPLNVLLVDQGRMIKLIDFGTTRQQEEEMTNAVGTATYMAPEVYVGKEYTTKCDVYSWSIMLWEILCRKIPLEKLECCAILFQKVMRKARPAPLQNCPKRIEDLITKCWAQIPEERPTMEEVALEMNELCKLFPGDLNPVYVDTHENSPIQGLVNVAESPPGLKSLPSPVSPPTDADKKNLFLNEIYEQK